MWNWMSSWKKRRFWRKIPCWVKWKSPRKTIFWCKVGKIQALVGTEKVSKKLIEFCLKIPKIAPKSLKFCCVPIVHTILVFYAPLHFVASGRGRAPPFFREMGVGGFCPNPKMGQILGHFCKNEGYFFKIFARYAREGTYTVTLAPWGVNTSIYRLKCHKRRKNAYFGGHTRKSYAKSRKMGVGMPPTFGENPYKTLKHTTKHFETQNRRRNSEKNKSSWAKKTSSQVFVQVKTLIL